MSQLVLNMSDYSGQKLFTLPFPIPEQTADIKLFKWKLVFSKCLSQKEKSSIERIFSKASFKISDVKYLGDDNLLEFVVNVPADDDRDNQVYSFEFWLFVEIDKITNKLSLIQGVDKSKWPYFRFPADKK